MRLLVGLRRGGDPRSAPPWTGATESRESARTGSRRGAAAAHLVVTPIVRRPGVERAQPQRLRVAEHAAAARERDPRGGEEALELVLDTALAVPPRERGHLFGREPAAPEQIGAGADHR